MDTEKWRTRLASGHWFSHLPEPFQHSLLAHARQRQLAAGQTLFKRGDPLCGLYAVLDGASVSYTHLTLPTSDLV